MALFYDFCYVLDFASLGNDFLICKKMGEVFLCDEFFNIYRHLIFFTLFVLLILSGRLSSTADLIRSINSCRVKL